MSRRVTKTSNATATASGTLNLPLTICQDSKYDGILVFMDETGDKWALGNQVAKFTKQLVNNVYSKIRSNGGKLRRAKGEEIAFLHDNDLIRAQVHTATLVMYVDAEKFIDGLPGKAEEAEDPPPEKAAAPTPPPAPKQKSSKRGRKNRAVQRKEAEAKAAAAAAEAEAAEAEAAEALAAAEAAAEIAQAPEELPTRKRGREDDEGVEPAPKKGKIEEVDTPTEADDPPTDAPTEANLVIPITPAAMDGVESSLKDAEIKPAKTKATKVSKSDKTDKADKSDEKPAPKKKKKGHSSPSKRARAVEPPRPVFSILDPPPLAPKWRYRRRTRKPVRLRREDIEKSEEKTFVLGSLWFPNSVSMET